MRVQNEDYLRTLYKESFEAWRPVAAGIWESFFVDKEGLLWYCGKFDVTASESRTEPTLVEIKNAKIRGVSAGVGFAVAVSCEGDVYTWGGGGFGRLGHGNDADWFVPTKVFSPLSWHRVRTVSTGMGHCVALTDKGLVFSWGLNRRGQCGQGKDSEDCVIFPRLVTGISGARSASAGNAHTLVVAEKTGALFSFGCNRFGQLGHGSIERIGEFSPKVVDHLRNEIIVGVAAGERHSLVLTLGGLVYACGSNVFGQLGLIETRICPLPIRVNVMTKNNVEAIVETVAVGGNSSCAVSDSGVLFTWGKNVSGDNVFETPTVVDGIQNVVAVSMSAMSVVAVTREGDVFGWGNARAFGKYDDSVIQSPQKIPSVNCTVVLCNNM
jgi:alpha-tubulin suppressor-like RCC1 family protein